MEVKISDIFLFHKFLQKNYILAKDKIYGKILPYKNLLKCVRDCSRESGSDRQLQSWLAERKNLRSKFYNAKARP